MTTTPIARRLWAFARALFHRTHGQDLIEYAMLAGIVTSVVVISLSDISTRVAGYYGTTVTEIATRTAAAGAVPGGGNSGGGNSGGSNNGGGSGGSGGSTGGTTGGNGNGNGKK